jgi:uncharacterized membrane protein (DUF485 family)
MSMAKPRRVLPGMTTFFYHPTNFNQGAAMGKTAHEIIQSDRFKALMRTRWTVSIVLTVILFIVYYGYILIVAFGKDFLGEKIGLYANYGILLGVGVIIASWALTGIYVLWANNYYDAEVDAIKKELL